MISEGAPAPEAIKNSEFPEAKGRLRLGTALDIAQVIDPAIGQPRIDKVVLSSVMSMEGRE